MISKERLQGNWNEVVGAVRREFGDLTGSELEQVKGNVDALVGLVQRKTGQSKEQIHDFLSNCCGESRATVNRFADQAAFYAEVAGDAVRENCDKAMESAQRGYQHAASTVSKRPIESIAIAAGAGLLAGLMVGISMRNRRS